MHKIPVLQLDIFTFAQSSVVVPLRDYASIDYVVFSVVFCVNLWTSC